MTTFYHRYDNGLRLIARPMPVRSVTIGVWVRAGSAYETAENNGISHFVEHMLFKGTKTRSAFDISKAMDDIGAQINAFTSREYTCYYTKSVDDDAEKCFDLLSDMLYRSAFAEDELKRERDVVLEEIAMVEDSPEDVCQELLTHAIYGDGSYGRTILGPKENVSAFTKSDILSYMNERYVPSDIVVVVVGNTDALSARALTEKYFDTATVFPASRDVIANPRFESRDLKKKKDVEQISFSIGFPGLSYDHEDIVAGQIASLALGGGMSSRLFQEVREKQGLAYSVYSYFSAARLDGTFSVYCGTSPQKLDAARDTVLRVLSEVKDNGLTQEEFARGKAQMRGGFFLGQESSYTLMNTFGKFMIQTDKLYDLDENIAKMESVTAQECNRVIREVLDFEKACSATVGRID